MQVGGASAGYVSISPPAQSTVQVTSVIPIFKVGQYIPDHPEGSWTHAGIATQTTTVASHIAVTSMNAGGAF